MQNFDCKLKVLELFAGIGACSKALDRIGIEHEIVDAVEIDKYAVTSFNAIHGTNFEPQDITEWDKDLEADLIMHGSPCQDFSVAGKQAGGDEGSGTRSSLMYETLRIVEKIKPKYVIWENVKNVISKKHKHNFDNYINRMNELGYNSYYQVLNAKDYGIPQNRERVFTVSIRKDLYVYDDYNSNIRKDQNTIGTLTTNCGSGANRNGWKIIETNRDFTFPEKEELKLKLKDVLEKKVDEKYYLSEKMENYILDNNNSQKGTKWEGRADNDVLNANIAHALSVRGAGGSQRAGVSNFIIDNMDEEIKVKDLKLKMQNINVNTSKIITYEVPQMVRVRKYEVDVEKLKEVLRDAKISCDLSNIEIATKLNVSLTTVEHWFRRDNYFSIPDPDIWYDLKNLLKITTNEFDKSIMTFEEKEGVYDKSNRIYDERGLAPTLTSVSDGEKIVTIDYKGKEVELPVACASRGRNPENPSSRVSGEHLEQTIEVNTQGTSNCISTVQKDNYIMEPNGNVLDVDSIIEENNKNAKHQQDLLQTEEGICRTIPAGTHASTPHLLKTVIKEQQTSSDDRQSGGLRIRKLTPKECWRLMGFDDEDFEKARKSLNDIYHKGRDMSNSQLYKQAGNSIVVDVLERIFKNLFYK